MIFHTTLLKINYGIAYLEQSCVDNLMNIFIPDSWVKFLTILLVRLYTAYG